MKSYATYPPLRETRPSKYPLQQQTYHFVTPGCVKFWSIQNPQVHMSKSSSLHISTTRKKQATWNDLRTNHALILEKKWTKLGGHCRTHCDDRDVCLVCVVVSLKKIKIKKGPRDHFYQRGFEGRSSLPSFDFKKSSRITGKQQMLSLFLCHPLHLHLRKFDAPVDM